MHVRNLLGCIDGFPRQRLSPLYSKTIATYSAHTTMAINSYSERQSRTHKLKSQLALNSMIHNFCPLLRNSRFLSCTDANAYIIVQVDMFRVSSINICNHLSMPIQIYTRKEMCLTPALAINFHLFY